LVGGSFRVFADETRPLLQGARLTAGELRQRGIDVTLICTRTTWPREGGEAKTGDFSAFVSLGMDAAGYFYCEADLKHRPVPQIVADGVEHFRQFQPDGFGVETNQFQELLVADFQRVGREQKIHLPLYGVPNTIKKQVRIRRLGSYLKLR
jgi:hypothetical protein